MLLRRHPVGVIFKDPVLLVGKARVLLSVPRRGAPIIRTICKHAGINANPLDCPAGLGGHGSRELDLGAFFYLSLLIFVIVL